MIFVGACSGSEDSGSNSDRENETGVIVEPTPQTRITVGTDSTNVEIYLSRENPAGKSGTAVIETIGYVTTVTVGVEPPSNVV